MRKLPPGESETGQEESNSIFSDRIVGKEALDCLSRALSSMQI